jgi:hypothetical protein
VVIHKFRAIPDARAGLPHQLMAPGPNPETVSHMASERELEKHVTTLIASEQARLKARSALGRCDAERDLAIFRLNAAGMSIRRIDALYEMELPDYPHSRSEIDRRIQRGKSVASARREKMDADRPEENPPNLLA